MSAKKILQAHKPSAEENKHSKQYSEYTSISVKYRNHCDMYV